MPLDQHQEAKARAWLERHFRGCRNCASEEVTFGDIVTTSAYSAHPIAVGRQFSDVPVLQVICKICAFIHLFDVRAMNAL